MKRRRRLERASGILVGFTSRWNPFTTKVNVVIKSGDKTMKIPIDYRQRKFIEKEYPVGSKVEVERYEGNWRIKSQLEPLGVFNLDVGTTVMPSSGNAYK